MRYEGYHPGPLPFKAGDVVLVPKGTTVRTMHPSRDYFVTKRAQRVIVHHTLSGISIPGNEVAYKPHRFEHLANFKSFMIVYGELSAQIEAHSGTDEASVFYRLRDNLRFHTMNPKVVWAGSGGYWNEVDINDVVLAPAMEIAA